MKPEHWIMLAGAGYNLANWASGGRLVAAGPVAAIEAQLPHPTVWGARLNLGGWLVAAGAIWAAYRHWR